MPHYSIRPFERWFNLESTPMVPGSSGCLWWIASTTPLASLQALQQAGTPAYDAAPQATATFSRQWIITATAT